MRLLRKTIFWIHLVVGLTVGLGVALMAGTGIVLAFEHQIVDWAEHAVVTPPDAKAERLPVEDLLYRAREMKSDASPTAITLARDPTVPASVVYGKEGRLQLDPYTGQRVGREATTLRAFFAKTLELHRWLTLSGDYRNTGRAITGAVSLSFLGLMLTGLVLWVPKKLRWASIKPVLLLNFRLKGKPRDWNWHNVLGLWAALPILVTTLTGAVISYTWANDLLYRALGDTPPPPRTAAPRAEVPRQNERRPMRPANYDGLNDLWAAAEAGAVDWTSITLRLSSGRRGSGGGGGGNGGEAAGVQFVIADGNAEMPFNRTTVTLDRRTGELVKLETFSDLSIGRRARMLIVPIHRGEIGGIAGQTLMALACVATLILIYTGFALSYRRLIRPLLDRVHSHTTEHTSPLMKAAPVGKG